MVFFNIFGWAFLVALSGAMTPGPLLTYTVYKSIEAKKKAFLVGLYVILGHAILEFILILILLGGMGPFISSPQVIIGIGLLGGILLIFLGGSLLRDLKQNKIDFSFLEISGDSNSADTNTVKKFSKHPILGGILISMSNPYWWFWWAVIGLNFMTQFSVSFENQIEFWGFFLGHELGDFVWYFSISVGLGFTHKFMTKRIYSAILISCSIFMVGFGIYLGVSPFFA